MPVRIDILTQDDASIVRLEGRFTTGSDAEFVRAKAGLADAGRLKVIVDCTDVPYLDSTALSFLIGLYTTTRNAGGRFVLCGLNARMAEVLRITHLDQIIPIEPTRQTALEAVSSPEARGEAADT